MTKKEKEIQKAIKTGNFTIYYYDNGSCYLVKGKYTQDEIEDEDSKLDELADFDYTRDEGYIPAIVAELVKALGGKVHST